MTRNSTGRHFRLPAGVAAVLLLLTGCATGDAQQPSDPPAARSAPSPDPADAEPEQTPSPAAKQDLPPSVALAMAPSTPVSLSIPTVNINSALMETALRADKTLEVPPGDEGSPASWYNGSAAPGSAGVSVLLGHVSSYSDASGVFFDLRQLHPATRSPSPVPTPGPRCSRCTRTRHTRRTNFRRRRSTSRFQVPRSASSPATHTTRTTRGTQTTSSSTPSSSA